MAKRAEKTVLANRPMVPPDGSLASQQEDAKVGKHRRRSVFTARFAFRQSTPGPIDPHRKPNGEAGTEIEPLYSIIIHPCQ